MDEVAVKAGGTPGKTLAQLGEEVRSLTQQAKQMNLYYAIEVGRRLNEAKMQVKHGEWGGWLKQETEFSQSTANRLMRVFDEYGAEQIGIFGVVSNSSTLMNLSLSNAVALFSVPKEEREEFAKEVGADRISARELERAIRERDEAKAAAEKEAAAAERLAKEVNGLNGRVKELESSNAYAGDRAKRAAEQLAEAEKKIKELESRPVDVAVQVDEEAVKKAAEDAKKAADAEWAAKVQEAEEAAKKAAEDSAKETAAAWADKLSKTEAKLAKAEEEAKKAADQAKTSGGDAEKDTERYKAEAEALRAELEAAKKAAAEEEAALKKKLAMSGEAITTFKLHFAAWQQAYQSMTAALAQTDEETAAKLRAAIAKQYEMWKGGAA